MGLSWKLDHHVSLEGVQYHCIHWVHIPLCELWGMGAFQGTSGGEVLWVYGIVTPSNVSHVTVCILTEDSGDSVLVHRSDSKW